MSIVFVPSQVGTSLEVEFEPWTGNPVVQCWNDFKLGWKHKWKIVGIVMPIHMWKTNKYGEYYPSVDNLVSMAVQMGLTIAQAGFIMTLPIVTVAMVPAIWIIGYIGLFVGINHLVVSVLNGDRSVLSSDPTLPVAAGVEREFWIYINGMTVSKHGLQQHINRLALTFQRRVVGVHNPTSGPIFDLLECIIQRNFNYATADVRSAYTAIKEALTNRRHSKVVFILHSQGGIIGSLIINWLLAEVPRNTLEQLEVYTFGNAANHFSNPIVYDRQSYHHHPSSSFTTIDSGRPDPKTVKRTITHIEHYANEGDFVSHLGVLAFAHTKNRYMGRVFKIAVAGHFFNQHYLDTIFPLDNRTGRVLDQSWLMNQPVRIENSVHCESVRQSLFNFTTGDNHNSSPDVPTPVSEFSQSDSHIHTNDYKLAAQNRPTVPSSGSVTPLSLPSIASTFETDGLDSHDRVLLFDIENLDGAVTDQDRPVNPESLRVKHFSRLWMYRNGRVVHSS